MKNFDLAIDKVNDSWYNWSVRDDGKQRFWVGQVVPARRTEFTTTDVARVYLNLKRRAEYLVEVTPLPMHRRVTDKRVPGWESIREAVTPTPMLSVGPGPPLLPGGNG